MKQIYLIVLLLVIIFINKVTGESGEIYFSPSIIELSALVGADKEELITFNLPVNITPELSKNIKEFIKLNYSNPTKELLLNVHSSLNAKPDIYSGYLKLKSNKFEKQIPIIINLQPDRNYLDLNLELLYKKININEELTGNLEVINLANFRPLKLTINTQIKDIDSNTIQKTSQIKVIDKQLVIPVKIKVPDPGFYYLYIEIISPISIERISKSFTVLEGQKIEKPSNKSRNLINIIIIPIILIIVLSILIYSIKKRIFFSRRKTFYFLFTLFIIILSILFTYNLITKDTTRSYEPRYYEPQLEYNISNILKISQLTNEPFLKNVTTNFLIYIADTTETIKPKIKVEKTESSIIISLSDAMLEISNLGKKYNFKIISKYHYPTSCNMFCIWKSTFLTETIAIVFIIFLMLIMQKYPKIKKTKIKQQLTQENLIVKTLSQLNSKNMFNIIRLFFVQMLNLEYEATIEEIIDEILKNKIKNKIKIIQFLNKLNISNYSQEHINKKQLINEFKNVIINLSHKPYKSKKV